MWAQRFGTRDGQGRLGCPGRRLLPRIPGSRGILSPDGRCAEKRAGDGAPSGRVSLHARPVRGPPGYGQRSETSAAALLHPRQILPTEGSTSRILNRSGGRSSKLIANFSGYSENIMGVSTTASNSLSRTSVFSSPSSGRFIKPLWARHG